MPNVNLPDELYKAIKQQARDEERAISTVIRRAWHVYIAGDPFRDPPPRQEEKAAA